MTTIRRRRTRTDTAFPTPMIAAAFLLAWSGAVSSGLQAAEAPGLVRSVRNGPWSASGTWEGGRVPAAGSRVQVRQGHTVIYDMNSDRIIRSLHVAGTLRFAHDKTTRLDVGLIKIQPGEDAGEEGFD